MLHGVLRYLHSPDAPDLESYQPENHDCFSLFVQAMYGSSDSDGEESFGMIICNSGWLRKEVEKVGVLIGFTHLIVDRLTTPQYMIF